MQPWLINTWGIPPKADADFVYHMEDGLQTYQRPYTPACPVVCMDEASQQCSADIAGPRPPRPGQVKRIDDAYERQGIGNPLMRCKPLRGWRHVKATQRRTKRDWACCSRARLEVD